MKMVTQVKIGIAHLRQPMQFRNLLDGACRSDQGWEIWRQKNLVNQRWFRSAHDLVQCIARLHEAARMEIEVELRMDWRRRTKPRAPWRDTAQCTVFSTARTTVIVSSDGDDIDAFANIQGTDKGAVDAPLLLAAAPCIVGRGYRRGGQDGHQCRC